MSTNDRPLAGRTALITGAGTGIGRVLAIRYAAAGARVALAARRTTPLEETAALVEAAGGEVWTSSTDVRDETECTELVARCVARFGGVNVLLNNAAVPGSDQLVAEMDLANWNDTLATDLTAPMVLAREVLRQSMVPAGSGNIQFFSSAVATSILPRKAHYIAAKAALVPLAQTIAMEVGRHGVRVNTLVIGTVHGELVDNYAARIAAERGVERAVVLDELAASTALGRLVRPEEVAEVSVWLASDAASAITGQAIAVTAGAEKR